MALPKYILKELDLIIDTREQKPYTFKGYTQVHKKLQFGRYSWDYGFSLKGEEIPIYFERKSCEDGISTFTVGRERFYKKLKIAKELGHTVFLILEYDQRSAFNIPLHSNASRKVLINAPLSWATQGLCIPIFCSNRTQGKNTIIAVVEAYYRHNFKK